MNINNRYLWGENEKNFKLNRIKILSALQDGNAYGFNELLKKTGLYPTTLNKHLIKLDEEKLIQRFGDERITSQTITEKGRDEYKRLITEKEISPIVPEMNLLDFSNIPKTSFETNQGNKINISGNFLSSDILTNEKLMAITENQGKVLSTIAQYFGDITASGSIIFNIRGETPKK